MFLGEVPHLLDHLDLFYCLRILSLLCLTDSLRVLLQEVLKLSEVEASRLRIAKDASNHLKAASLTQAQSLLHLSVGYIKAELFAFVLNHLVTDKLLPHLLTDALHLSV
ncbi:hypothetical protein EVA_04664 [gut metagenome]|uniref:Uncharacterized protein n=1 Tax=gut metagenome TaxID=749906 RepID=J9H1D9_9ZZZZ